MSDLGFMLGLIAVMILMLGVFAVIQSKKTTEIREKYPGYPKGHWMTQGISLGVALGAALGVALGNIAIGVGVGVAIGAANGSRLEKQHQAEIRPITEEEEKLDKQALVFAACIFMLGVIIFLIRYFLTR